MSRPKVCLYEYKQNDPKKDTGMLLVSKNLAKVLPMKVRFQGIILSADTNHVISRADREIIDERGICGINCSWNKVAENRMPVGKLRKLPFVVPANPINYGKAMKLSTAEALAAGLEICGYDSQHLMEPFKWSAEFYRLNEDLFRRYRECQNPAEIVRAEQVYCEEAERQRQERKAVDIYPSSDEYTYEEEEFQESPTAALESQPRHGNSPHLFQHSVKPDRLVPTPTKL